MGVRVSLMAAVTPKGVIGRDNYLPWHYPEDLKKFRQVTLQETVVVLVGRKTWDSIPVSKTGEKLPGRKVLVLSSTFKLGAGNIAYTTIIDDITLKALEKSGISELIVIGGAQVYELMEPYATHLYLSRIKENHEGNVKFPGFKDLLFKWAETSRETLSNTIDFVTYERKQGLKL